MTGVDYVLAYLLFMGLSLPLAILAAAAAYQFTRRTDLSLVLFAAFAGLSLTVWADNWQLCWLNPCVWALSDDFSNFRIFRSVAYMRLTWLAALAGVWTLSYLCIRQYGKGLLGLPGPQRPAGLPPGASPCSCWPAPVPPMPPSPWWTTATRTYTVMTFFELPYAGGRRLHRPYRPGVS